MKNITSFKIPVGELSKFYRTVGQMDILKAFSRVRMELSSTHVVFNCEELRGSAPIILNPCLPNLPYNDGKFHSTLAIDRKMIDWEKGRG